MEVWTYTLWLVSRADQLFERNWNLYWLVTVAYAEILQHLALPAPCLFDVISLWRDLLVCDFCRGYRWSRGSGIETAPRRQALRLRIFQILEGERWLGGEWLLQDQGDA